MCFMRCCEAWCIFASLMYICKSDGCLDLFPYISRGVRTRSLYMASPCVKSWSGRFVSLYFTWWSNTELERVKILAVDIDYYFDPKIITFDQCFIAYLLSFFWEIILSYHVIFPIYFIYSFEQEKYDSHLERERVTWVHFWVYFWVYVYTLVSGVHTVFYNRTGESICLSELL